MFPMFFMISILSSLIFPHSLSQCLHHQKTLLLQLKSELIFNSSISTKLMQWNEKLDECCKWHGVECDGGGNIISLQLDEEAISGGIGDTSSLFGLKYLEKLNLAYNDFNSSVIPKGIKHLKYLTHLNLSYAGFSGQVPLEISSLRRLISLEISVDKFRRYVEPPILMKHPNLEMLVQNLTGLRELYLNGINITSFRERRNWSHIISSYLPNITILSLAGCSLKGSFPDKIFQIPTLQHLDLSWNRQLSGSLPPFPHSGSLKSLRLGWTNLSGSIPSSIGNLKSLSEIDLSMCRFGGPIPSTFANLTQLTRVNLGDNSFTGKISPTMFEGFPNLVFLSLRNNSFTGKIPNSLFHLPSLRTLNLYNNNFTGVIEEFPTINISKIVTLVLSGNRLEGPIPDSFFQFRSLENLLLGGNLLNGSFQLEKIQSFANLTQLDLSGNNFSGVIEEFPTINVSKIVRLDLRDNQLEGPIPDSFFQLQSLLYLDLSGNLFNGSFQLEKIQSFANLTFLDLSDNNLSVHVRNDDNSTTYGLPKLSWLILRSCNMHDFPHFLKLYSNQMDTLDLSNNRISGEIPNWIWGTQLFNLKISFNLLTHVQKPYNIPPSLRSLDLQSNQLKEELHLPFPPNIIPNLYSLSLANNSLSGSIPTSLCSATVLSVLDLSMNQLSGTIPTCLFDETMSLRALDMGGNNISGHIPDSLGLRCHLQYLNLSNNTLQGKIPNSLKSCKGLELMNVGNNLINDTFPCMLSSSLRVLVLRSNRFYGEVMCHNNSWPDLQIIDISSNDFSGSLKSVNYSSWKGMVLESFPQVERTELRYGISRAGAGVRITMKGVEVQIVKIFPEFTTIDFSSNNFHGEIPKAIGDLSSLRLLNVSHNAINGSIPKSFGKLGKLESLDLSQNQLTGHIPTELSRLTFLSVFNVSYNRLIGEIPKGSQLQTFSADSFIGNPGLCGFNLNISCIVHTDDGSDENEKEKKREIDGDYVSGALGYVVGLGGFVWVLILCRSFRYRYFGKIEEIVEDIFDARDRRRRRRSHVRREERNRVRRRRQ